MFVRILVAALVAAQPVAALAQTPLPGISVTQKGPDSAPITIVEFSDFECPFCARMPPVLQQLLDEYPDQIRLVFKHSPLPIHSNAPLAHEAALAAAAQGKFWEMHDLLFANQKQLTLADLIGYATTLKLDVPAFTAALNDHRYQPLLRQDLLEARAYGVDATPTFFVNGRRYSGAPPLATLRNYVDVALGRTALQVPPPNSSDPRVGPINLDRAPVRGAADAQVTIVEFSDLQCPFCAQTTPVMQQIMNSYDGKVKWVFKHFPLSIHSNAMMAHQAALAAAEQGKFWEMHDALFADQKNARRDAIITMAGKLGLDVSKFITDLDNPTYKSRIDTERQQGTGLGVSGTPTFFINGRRLVGAKSFPEMKAVIDQELVGRPVSTEESAVAPTPEPAGPDVSRGDEKAPITLLWFSDLRSSLTPKAMALVNQIVAANPNKIRVVFKNRPLETRPQSRLAHEAALAAAAQGHFWPMHDAIVSEPAGSVSRETLVAIAARLGLDNARFVKDLDSGAFRDNIDRDLVEARRRDVRGTPVFFLNGIRIDGIQPPAYFQRFVDEEIRKRSDK
jgi:protein-disulfide isomerase